MSDAKKNPLAQLNLTNILLLLRRRTYLTVAIVSWVTMAVLALLVVVPQFNQILANTQNLASEEDKLSALQARSAFLLALDGPDVQSQLAVLQKALPSQKPVIPLISSIEKLAADAGVSLDKYELSPGSIATGAGELSAKTTSVGPVEGTGALPLKLEVQGGFVEMNNFFKLMDQIVPLINVKSIEFSSLSQNLAAGTENSLYKATVELDSLYVLPGSEQIALDPVLTAFTQEERLLIASLSAMAASQPVPQAGFSVPTATSGAALRQSVFSF